MLKPRPPELNAVRWCCRSRGKPGKWGTVSVWADDRALLISLCGSVVAARQYVKDAGDHLLKYGSSRKLNWSRAVVNRALKVAKEEQAAALAVLEAAAAENAAAAEREYS
jgi:hypothetical protein